MVNPTITQKEATRLTLSESAKQLFQVIYREQNKPSRETDEPKIRVSDIVSKVAFYYEKIRNTVDYKEEHLLYKDAIDRIIKRQINIELSKDGNDIARHLLSELIRAGYLPNNKVPETKIDEVGLIINKYLQLKKSCQATISNGNEQKREILNWVVSLAACEIEEKLNRSNVNQVVISTMHDILNKNIKFPDDSPYLRDKDIQLYIGIYRSFIKADRDMMSLVLLKYYVSNWSSADEEAVAKTAKNIEELYRAISFQLQHPLSGQLAKLIDRYTVYYSVLIEVISNDPVGVYEEIKKDPKAFPRLIKGVCAKRYKGAKSKLWRAAIRSIIYLFLTKMILVLLLEIPVARLLGEDATSLSLAINVTFPPLLLFLIVLFTKVPGDNNSAKIIDGINELVFEEHERKEPFRLRTPAKRTGGKNAIFGVIYGLTFFTSFGAVVWLLNQINFTFVSITIFLFFLALISFFSIRIRKRVKELIVVEPKENIFGFMVDFFYIPIVAVGKWLSEKFSKINVIVFVLDFIIEAPFKIFVEIAEEWTKYVRERKEDISQ